MIAQAKRSNHDSFYQIGGDINNIVPLNENDLGLPPSADTVSWVFNDVNSDGIIDLELKQGE